MNERVWLQIREEESFLYAAEDGNSDTLKVKVLIIAEVGQEG